jgi:hypothetical protein
MNKLKLFMLISALPLLINCGGGGGGESSTATVVTPSVENVTEETESDTQETETDTTLLIDNPIPQVSTVKVFDNYSIDIDMTEINMQGDYLFLKITNKDKKALFLGQVVHHGNIKVPLTIVADSFPLIVEMYSESKEDKTISYEVYYD